MYNNYNYWFWNKVFDLNKIKQINSFIDKNFQHYEEKNLHATDEKGNSTKNAIVKIIDFKKIKYFLDDLKDKFLYSARFNFGYEIFDIMNIDRCNLNIYSSKNLGSYDWHTDTSKSDIFDVKLTVLINLSFKKYEGGNFYLWETGEFEIKELNTPGNAIMFKSYMNHKVAPVTKGERRTLAIFLKGPKFK
jgi:hypothetical protein